MKLSCRCCGTILTTDLYKAKVIWERNYFSNAIANRKDIFKTDGHIKKGLFVESKPIPNFSYRYEEMDGNYINIICKKEPSYLMVGKESVEPGIIPPFKQGYGCCDYSGGYNLYCTCSNHIAALHLDCYEDGSVRFLSEEVIRLY